MIPIFVYFYITAETREEYFISSGVLFLSGLTDALDGFIARRFNQGTRLGQLLDPIADKLTQIAVVGVLMLKWPVFVFLFLLFIIKEGYMFFENVRLYRKNVTLDGSKWYGKVATIVFYLTMFLAVIFPTLSDVIVVVLVLTASVFQLIAFYHYAVLFRQMHKPI